MLLHNEGSLKNHVRLEEEKELGACTGQQSSLVAPERRDAHFVALERRWMSYEALALLTIVAEMVAYFSIAHVLTFDGVSLVQWWCYVAGAGEGFASGLVATVES